MVCMWIDSGIGRRTNVVGRSGCGDWIYLESFSRDPKQVFMFSRVHAQPFCVLVDFPRCGFVIRINHLLCNRHS
jgi:hypothetical protein